MIDVTVAPNGAVSFSCQADELPAVLDALRSGAPTPAAAARFVEAATAAPKADAAPAVKTTPAKKAAKAEAAVVRESVAAPADAFVFEKSTRDQIVDLKSSGFFKAQQSSKDIAAALQNVGVDASQSQVCAALSTMLKKNEIKRTAARPYRYYA